MVAHCAVGLSVFLKLDSEDGIWHGTETYLGGQRERWKGVWSRESGGTCVLGEARLSVRWGWWSSVGGLPKRPVPETRDAGSQGEREQRSSQGRAQCTVRFAVGTRGSPGSPTSVQACSTSLSQSASFPGIMWTNPNNSSFLTPFTALPTYAARILFAEKSKKVRGRRERAICSDYHLPEAATLPGNRAQGRDGTSRDLSSPHPSATGASFGEGREMLYWVVLFQKGSHQPNQPKPMPRSETLMLGPQLPSGEDGFKNKQRISWDCTWRGHSTQHNTGTGVFSVLLFLQKLNTPQDHEYKNHLFVYR